VKEPQRRFKVIDRRIARDDDGDPPTARLLQRRQHQRPRLDSRAGDIDAIVLDSLTDHFECLCPRKLRADSG